MLLALLVTACDADDPTGAAHPSTTRGTKASPSQGRISRIVIGASRDFVPKTRHEGRFVVMAVTFPDGSTADILYPHELEVAQLGVQPYSSGQLAHCCARDFFVRYAGVPSDELAGRRPLEVYDGSGEFPVEYWASSEGPSTHRWLIFRFGLWHVLISDQKGLDMGAQERATWARSLQGEVTEDGFLRLEASRP